MVEQCRRGTRSYCKVKIWLQWWSHLVDILLFEFVVNHISSEFMISNHFSFYSRFKDENVPSIMYRKTGRCLSINTSDSVSYLLAIWQNVLLYNCHLELMEIKQIGLIVSPQLMGFKTLAFNSWLSKQITSKGFGKTVVFLVFSYTLPISPKNIDFCMVLWTHANFQYLERLCVSSNTIWVGYHFTRQIRTSWYP